MMEFLFIVIVGGALLFLVDGVIRAKKNPIDWEEIEPEFQNGYKGEEDD
jgi:hypothetical protein